MKNSCRECLFCSQNILHVIDPWFLADELFDGAEAAQFLDFVKKLLEHPDELV